MSMKRVLAAQGRGEEVEKRRPEEESPEVEKEEEGEGGDRDREEEGEKEGKGEDVEEGKICGCRVFSRLSKQEARTDLSTKVTFCTFEMIFSICAEDVF